MLLANQIAVFFKCSISRVYFWHADKHGSFLQLDTIILGVQPYIPKVAKISLHIFALSPEKHGR